MFFTPVVDCIRIPRIYDVTGLSANSLIRLYAESTADEIPDGKSSLSKTYIPYIAGPLGDAYVSRKSLGFLPDTNNDTDADRNASAAIFIAFALFNPFLNAPSDIAERK
ncbi:hypothetical protein DERP_014534 [Dermatophagoides pteronyssinus]|uniref:Uncharacterized protein n=1 Tax=Dermatophagoides pteronyssinus TaxID=6956 RepID=A0ABQ8J1W0_DERPT|nr:hypothetical protein DERP_014534 [Dermatophagoides pteronyssinus]